MDLNFTGLSTVAVGDEDFWRHDFQRPEFQRHGERGDGRVTIDARLCSDDSSSSERRRAEREPVEVDARLRELGSEGSSVTVLNISSTGFMAQVRDEVAVGARVWLILPGRERANAVVRWVEGNRIGAEFAAPVDPAGLVAR